MFWLLGMYVLHTWGELCLSPIGLSMVARLAPLRLASLLMGVWFLANAMANDFAGMLSKLYPEAGKATSLFGYQIANLNDFFMVFVVFSGVAALVLFLLSRVMLKMMHGLR
jgi:POT family proton-dependent oligopeptide transporter